MTTTFKVPQALYDGFALDGQLSPKQFTKLCYSLGYFLTPKEVDLAFVLIDGDGDGKISREEFFKFWQEDKRFQRLQLDTAQQQRLFHIGQFFQKFDKDESGALDPKEFALMHEEMQRNSAGGASIDFSTLDRNSDGKITFNEFIYFMIDRGSLDAEDGTRPLHG